MPFLRARAIVAIAALASPVFPQGVPFPIPQFEAELRPQLGRCGDFNGDGKLDFAFCGNWNSNLAFRPGDGAGRFGPAFVTALPQNLVPAFADMNVDGADDFVALRGDAPNGFIRFGGPAGFGPPIDFALRAPASWIAIADVNNDGIPDLLHETSHLVVLLGVGDGTFASPPGGQVVQGISRPVVGDVTGDGFADLVAIASVSSSSTHLSTYLGDGQGGFAAGPSTASAFVPLRLALSDVDGDGRADAVTTAGYAPFTTVYTWHSNPDGSFATPVACPIPANSGAIVLADFDGDGDNDFVTNDLDGSQLTTARNPGNGAFQSWQVLAAGSVGWDCDAGDFDADGRIDLLAVQITGCSVLLGLGGGAFVQPASYAVGFAPEGIAGGDFDGDGATDAVVIDGASAVLAFLPGNGAAAFGAPLLTPLGGTPTSVTAVDADLDGTLDLIVEYQQMNVVDFRIGDGHGSFTQSFPNVVSSVPQGALVADIDGNGSPDVAVPSGAWKALILLGNGTGLLNETSPAFFEGQLNTAVCFAELDGDGRPELVANRDSFGGTIQVDANLGNGTFGAPQPFGPYLTPSESGIAPADLDGDGWSDIVATRKDGGLAWLQGVGLDSFGASWQTDSTFFGGIRCLDLDGDGRVDLVGCDVWGGSVHVAFGEAPFQFSPCVGAVAGAVIRGWFAADLDGDGVVEIVVASRATQSVNVLRATVPHAMGAVPYRLGSHNCLGRAALHAATEPKLGNAAFGVAFSNAPPSAVGVLLIANAPDPGGSDPLGLGIPLLLDLVHATEVGAAASNADFSGTGFVALPVPNSPYLANTIYYAQAVWLESPAAGWACGPSPLHLVSSNGIGLLLTP